MCGEFPSCSAFGSDVVGEDGEKGVFGFESRWCVKMVFDVEI